MNDSFGENIRKTTRDAFAEFERQYKATGIKLKLPHFIALFLLLSLAAAIVGYEAVSFLPGSAKENGPILSVFAFASLMSLVIGIPVSMRNSRIESINEAFPDALKQMSAVLRAGGTTESALEEVAEADYGPLSQDLKTALARLREGILFEEVMMDTARNSGSKFFERVMTIVLDAKKAGAGLSDVMDALAEDAREIMRISRERVSRTTMPVMFLYTLTLFIAPFIFGFTLTVVSFIGSGMQLAGGDGSPASDLILNLVLMLSMAPLNRPLFELKTSALGFVLVNFLCLQAVISTFAIGIIREGKYLKYLLRAPFMILISMIFYISGLTLAAMIVK